MKALFRVDGGEIADISTGHIYRALRIADHIKNLASEILFCSLSKPEFELGWAIIASSQYPIVVGNLSQLRKFTIAFCPDAIFFDQYNYNSNDIEFFHSIAKNILFTFDDPGPKLSDRHCQINALVHNSIAKPVLKELVLPTPRLNAKSYMDPKKIFVSFGGHDHCGILNRVLKQLINLKCDLNITCVPPKRHVFSEDVLRLVNGVNLCIYVSPPNFDELLANCDFAITSGGLTFFQCLSEQLVTLALAQYPHQDEALCSLAPTKAFKYLGMANDISDDALQYEITEFFTNSRAIKHISDSVKHLEIGHGLTIIDEMLGIR